MMCDMKLNRSDSENAVETQVPTAASSYFTSLRGGGRGNSRNRNREVSPGRRNGSFDTCQKSNPFPRSYLFTPFQTPPDIFLSHSNYMEVKEPPSNLTNGSDWDALSTSVWKYFIRNQQSEVMYKNKIALWKYLYMYLRSHSPSYGLFVVGSTLSGFGVNRSDLDMCLHVRPKGYNRERGELIHLTNIYMLISKEKFITDPEVIPAKVPILKFCDVEHGVKVDLNCNNVVGIRNTHLMFCYSQLDDRVRPLVIAVKMWAHQNGINDAKNGTLSSYSLALMVIHFLQCGVRPSVLPCLNKMYPEKFHPKRSIGVINVHERLPPYSSNNRMPLGQLLLKFFEYYSNFQFLTCAISVREGCILNVKDCREVVTPKNDQNQWNYICVEEPFELTNTARAVYDVGVYLRIKNCFHNTYKILKRTLKFNSILNVIDD